MKLGHHISESQARWPELTDQLLEELQTWAQQHSLGEVPLEQLALFAHSCYYDKEATLRCMETYYKMRATVPKFFNDRDPLLDAVQLTMKATYYIALPTDKQGNRVIYHSLRDTSPNSYIFCEAVKLLFMTMDASLYTEGCVPGHVFLFDMRGVKLGHFTKLLVQVNGIMRFFEYIQEAMPVRLKAIHVLNCVWFFDKVLALTKPFMKKELLEILHLHTGDVSEIYQYIPPECLPKDLGGELDDFETLQGAHCKKLTDLRGYFLEEERLYRSYRSTNGSSACAGAEELGRDEDVGPEEAS